MTPEQNESAEAKTMWAELKGHQSFDSMNEFWRIQLDRIEAAHKEYAVQLEDRIIAAGIQREELEESNAVLRKRIDWLHLGLFACALALAYLVVKG